MSSEGQKVAVIVIVFSLAYLCRFVYDVILYEEISQLGFFWYQLVQINVLLLFDIVPLSLILHSHHVNFNASLQAPSYEDERESD